MSGKILGILFCSAQLLFSELTDDWLLSSLAALLTLKATLHSELARLRMNSCLEQFTVYRHVVTEMANEVLEREGTDD